MERLISVSVGSVTFAAAILVSVILIILVVLPKFPSQSWCSTTFKKSHTHSHPPSVSVLLPYSDATPLPLSPSQSSCPKKRNRIDCGHLIDAVGVLPIANASAVVAPTVVATIEWRRIPSARLRRVLYRRR